MSYRDDHEAALRRIADLEKRLEDERAAHAADESRVAELEKELAEARREVSRKPVRTAPARTPGSGAGWAMLPALLFPAGLGVMIFFGVRGCVRGGYDGTQWLAVASDEAKSWAPDAVLMRMEGTLVDSRGRADATYGGRWVFSFRSQSRALLPKPADPPPPLPGAPRPRAAPWPGCQYTCSASRWKGGWRIGCSEERPSQAECGTSLATPVRCSLQQVWQRARQRGAPDPALANIVLFPVNGQWSWHFTVFDRAKERQVTLFDAELPDDC